jgi:hypothetical protein
LWPILGGDFHAVCEKFICPQRLAGETGGFQVQAKAANVSVVFHATNPVYFTPDF